MTPEQVKELTAAIVALRVSIGLGLSLIAFWLFCIFVVQFIRLTREKSC